MAAVMHDIAMLPVLDCLLGCSELFYKDDGGPITDLDRRLDLPCLRRLAVNENRHVRAPLRISLRTDLAMSGAVRPESVRLSEVEHLCWRHPRVPELLA